MGTRGFNLCPSLYLDHTLCMRAANALVCLHICVSSSEPCLHVDSIGTVVPSKNDSDVYLVYNC